MDSKRLLLILRGAVQGVGFRPFVYRLAGSCSLAGLVRNTTDGLHIEVEGAPAAIAAFTARLEAERPALARITSREVRWVPVTGDTTFIIAPSAEGQQGAMVLPDVALCPDCRRELFDPSDRRFRYPFINCTNCGPRATIIHRLPYDRPATSMAAFPMCGACEAEYHDPANRRFHAQPLACPVCGPHVTLAGAGGAVIAHHDSAMHRAATLIREGAILAIKGLGGFHLVCDAANERAVATLRQRKQRPTKPLAVMVPGLAYARTVCAVSPVEEGALASPEAPIVLAVRLAGATGIAPSVAPGNPELGIFLPSTPLHALLLHDLGTAVVATSGNLSDEPMVYENDEAVRTLGHVADYFLFHNRPIVRPMDDSVIRVVAGQLAMVRRARGYAPAVELAGVTQGGDGCGIVALGGHLKNTVAFAAAGGYVVSAHVGDLDDVKSCEHYGRTIADLTAMYGVTPAQLITDLYPGYGGSRHAQDVLLPTVTVQHHVAHVFAAIAEAGYASSAGQSLDLAAPVLGLAWDGSGHGTDGTVWGGEWLLVATPPAREEPPVTLVKRVAHLHTFPLPGGERAVRDGRRCAAGLWYEVLVSVAQEAVSAGDPFLPERGMAQAALETPAAFFATLPPGISAGLSAAEQSAIFTQLVRGIATPRTSSMGRLFDGVAALTGVALTSTFEGEGAMALEYAARGGEAYGEYGGAGDDPGAHRAPPAPGTCPPIAMAQGNGVPAIADWRPLVGWLVRRHQVAPDEPGFAALGAESSRAFHAALADLAIASTHTLGATQFVLTGGCFLNRLLAEAVLARAPRHGIAVCCPRVFPVSDGALSIGQLEAVRRNFKMV